MQPPPSSQPPLPEPRPAFLTQRLQSLDAYRGLIMATLAFSGFGLAATASNHLQKEPASFFWQTIKFHFAHVEWAGCAYWDLIQPSFMFMVGAAMAFSYSRRRELGQTYFPLFRHALWRAVVLVFLGIFLISSGQRSTVWSLMNVLTQIGLGYPFLFLLWGRSFPTQALAAALVLLGTWLLYFLYPAPGIDLERGAPEVGISTEWAQKHLADIPPAWHKNANAGQAIDLWLLDLPPRKEPFRFNSGGYQSINFLPSLATMIFGLMSGQLLRSGRTNGQKLWALFLAGLAGLLLGQVLSLIGICPLIKRIWTPSWALFSSGWCCLILAGLFAVVDVLGYRRWTFPLVVVGVNSIAIYCMSMLLGPWAGRTWQTHLGEQVFRAWGPWNTPLGEIAVTWGPWEPLIRATLIGLLFWLACWWMYRQKLFIRI